MVINRRHKVGLLSGDKFIKLIQVIGGIIKSKTLDITILNMGTSNATGQGQKK